MKGEIKPTILTPTFKEMALPDVRTQALEAVAHAFDIPKTILQDDSANYATSQQSYRTYITQTIEPRTKFLANKLNELLAPQGLKVEFDIQELPEMQEDENQRATAFKAYVDAGVPKRIAAALLGLDIPKDFVTEWSKIDEKKESPPPVIVPQPPNGQAGGVRSELKKWEKKSLTRFREGKGAACEFVSDDISDELSQTIKASLQAASTEAEIKGAFANPNSGPHISVNVSIPPLDVSGLEKNASEAIQKASEKVASIFEVSQAQTGDKLSATLEASHARFLESFKDYSKGVKASFSDNQIVIVDKFDKIIQEVGAAMDTLGTKSDDNIRGIIANQEKIAVDITALDAVNAAQTKGQIQELKKAVEAPKTITVKKRDRNGFIEKLRKE